jgi:two-component system sensor histidine kinase ChiS
MIITKKISLARDFTAFSGIIFFIVLSISLGVGLLIHQSYYDKRGLYIGGKANLLERELAESFGFISHYAHFLGNKVVYDSGGDPSYIDQAFITESHISSNERIWTKFIWIDQKTKKDPSLSYLLNKTESQPNVLQFSYPTRRQLSDEWVIAVGVGIIDQKGKYLGTVSTEIILENLANKLEVLFNRKDLAFMVLDDEMNFILASSNLNFSHERILPSEKILKEIENSLIQESGQKGNLQNQIKTVGFNFTYFRHSYQYPFYFLLGEDIKINNIQYWKITFPRIAELILMGFLFTIVLYYFRKHIVKPIILLAESAKKIASGKEEEIEIYYGQYQEVDFLAEQLKEIHNTKKELLLAKRNADMLNKNLEHKVKERTTELENALATKTEFLNNISHEVRTPVQGITTISQGLVEKWDSYTDEKRLALASAVASNSQRLFSLVSNLLDLATFNTGKVLFNMQEVNLIKVINNVIKECESLYVLEKDIKIIFAKHPIKIMISIDPEKISQVLRNLITNSIKFMENGRIYISLTLVEDRKSCNITIRDEGINIPEEELEQIFNPFTRGHKTKNLISGAGLGLSICKKIINGHNGKIWAENNKDRGVSFIFSLPIEGHPMARFGDKDITKPSVSEKTGNILMIDDEPSCQMSMDILLSNTGYNLISAYGGVSGLQYLLGNVNNVDLVLLDLMMPDMYGLKVLQEIRANPLIANIPVIIQTGTNDYREIEKALAMGAKAYMRKPYQRQQVLEIIAATLSFRQ